MKFTFHVSLCMEIAGLIIFSNDELLLRQQYDFYLKIPRHFLTAYNKNGLFHYFVYAEKVQNYRNCDNSNDWFAMTKTYDILFTYLS